MTSVGFRGEVSSSAGELEVESHEGHALGFTGKQGRPSVADRSDIASIRAVGERGRVGCEGECKRREGEEGREGRVEPRREDGRRAGCEEDHRPS